MLQKKIPKSFETIIFKSLFHKGCYLLPKKRDTKQFGLKYKYVCAILRNLVLNYWIVIHNKRKKHLKELCEAYSGNNLVLLSNKYDVPPYQLYLWLTKDCKCESAEKNIAIESDHFTFQKSQTASLRFEKAIGKDLSNINISYKTQDDLLGQKLTPDFLLENPIMFMDSKVHWIDAKNFYGGDNSFTQRSLQKQAQKYNEAFGNGMFIFRYSCCVTLTVKNTILVSYGCFKSNINNIYYV